MRNLKKPLLLILGTMAVAIGLVVSLAWVALRPLNQKNGFNRKFIQEELTLLDEIKKDEIVTGIAGFTNYSIFFRTQEPSRLWVTDRNLKNGKYIATNIPSTEKITSAFYITVDSPSIYVMACNAPAVILGNVNGNTPTVNQFPSALFTRAVALNQSSFIFRGFDTLEKRGQIFYKGDPLTSKIERKNTVSGKEDDLSGITSDGYLNYDKTVNLISYVSFYRNKFFCLDTNLNLLYTAHTIDTVGSYQIKADIIGNTATNVAPTKLINGKSRVGGGNLFINSKLQADNENEYKKGRSSTIDVYSLTNGTYKGSFFIPYYKKEKMVDFKALDNNILIVVYPNYVVKYELSKELL